MACYGVDTAPIDRLAILIRDFPQQQVMDLEQDGVAAFARERSEALREIEQCFLESFSIFLQILLAIAKTRLNFPEQNLGRDFREYRGPFLSLYPQAADRALRLLSQVLAEAFNQDASLRVEFASGLGASMLAEEMSTCVHVMDTAHSTAEADSHAKTATEITDSAKDFIKSFLSHIPLVRGLKKRNVDLTLHVINEIKGIVFPGH